jgi:putative oxidoreductase
MMDWASLVLRIPLGLMFMAHGSQKALKMFGGPGIGGFSEMLSGLGFQPPVFWAYLAAYTELICGLCLILGLFTRVSALLLLILIIVATITVHLKNGFFLSAGGFEYSLIITSVCLAILIIGAGKFSVFNKLQ